MFTKINSKCYWQKATLQEVKKRIKEDKECLNELGNFQRTPIHHIVDTKFSNIEVLKFVLKKDNRANRQDIFGKTPLFLASQNGNTEAVKILIQRGEEVNRKNKCDVTPLMIAVQMRYLEIVEALIEAGALVNERTTYLRENALQYACTRTNKHEIDMRIVNALLKAKADPCIQNMAHQTPLHLAAEAGSEECIRALIDAGAERVCIDKANQTPLKAAMLLKHPTAILDILTTPDLQKSRNK